MKLHPNGDQIEGDGARGTARYMANQLLVLFQAHDRGHRREALEACQRVDSLQFQFLDEDSVRLASTALIDALWAKDDVELRHLRGGDLDREGIRTADYRRVTVELRKRASIVGADPRYAPEKTKAWRRHKGGGDYWTPYQRAQMYELRAALQDPHYPRKPRHGEAGPGPEAMRYVLASELHDMNKERYFKEGVEVLVPYFARIIREYEDESGR